MSKSIQHDGIVGIEALVHEYVSETHRLGERIGNFGSNDSMLAQATHSVTVVL